MKLKKIQQLVQLLNEEGDNFAAKVGDVLGKDITQEEVLKLINKISDIKEKKVRKYILIGRRVFKITDDLLMDSASDYATYENLLMSNRENPISALHNIISIYLKPLFRKKNQVKTSKYILEHMDYSDAMSVYRYLKKKEMKHFYRMRTFLLKQSRMID